MYERVRFGNETFFLHQKKKEDQIQAVDNKITILTRIYGENVQACRLFYRFNLNHLKWVSKDINRAWHQE